MGLCEALDRRLRHLSINYIDNDTPLETVKNPIAEKLDSPGSLERESDDKKATNAS